MKKAKSKAQGTTNPFNTAIGHRYRVIKETDSYNAAINVTACHYRKLQKSWGNQTVQDCFWRFFYNEAPGATIRIGGHKINLNPDNYFLIPPNEEFNTILKNNPRQFCIHFDAPQAYNQTTGNFYRFKMTDQVKNMIKLITPELRHEANFATDTGSFLCVALCAQSLAQIPDDNLVQKTENQIVKRLLTEIQEDCEWRVPIADIAKKNGIGHDTMSTLFKNQTGVYFVDYLFSQRLSRAKFLLENTNVHIHEVARLSGYVDRPRLSNMLKAKIGYSPAAYREMMQK
jgi:YesN/AraC family two-component response regulator